MQPEWDVFGVGTAAVDDLVIVEHFPLPDTKQPVQSLQRHGGGQTATALVAAARQGARTAFCCCLSDNELSRYTIQALESEQVDCSPMQFIPGSGPVHAVIIVDASSGSRTILYDSSSVREPDPSAIRPEWIRSSRIVFFDQNTPHAGLAAAKLARKYHVPVVADLEKTTLPDMDEILGHIDHLIVSDDFARRLTGLENPDEMTRALAEYERRQPRAATVITVGSQGCWFAQQDAVPVHQPAYSVPVVDTTGCGDVFHGAYSAAIARGEPVARAILLASATAALKASQPGGRAGIPKLETVERFLSG